jgi:hypothetical protein
MLALLEALVIEAGGSHAATDTDSMMIVASEHGGLYRCSGGGERDARDVECVRALTWVAVERIQRRFDTLNPYSPELVPDLIETEAENYGADGRQRQLWFHGVSAKRYVLTNDANELLVTTDARDTESESETPVGAGELGGDGGPDVIRKASEHGLGLYINPTPTVGTGDHCPKCRQVAASAAEHESCRRELFKEGCWRYIRDGIEPEWLDRMALSRTAITTPVLMRRFEGRNKRAPLTDRIRPFGFMLVGHPVDRHNLDNPERFLLVAPYETDPDRWASLDWRNVYDPDRAWRPFTVRPDDDPRALVKVVAANDIRVKTFRDVLDEYRDHPEPKSLGPDGLPCHRSTTGLLRRRPITVAAVHTIGKEGHGLDAAIDYGKAPTVADLTDGDPVWRLTLQAARHGVSNRALTDAATDRHTLKRALDGHPLRPDTRERITRAVSLHARHTLSQVGVKPPREREALLATYITHTDSDRTCPGCGKPIAHADGSRPRLYHDGKCRTHAWRKRQAAHHDPAPRA